MSKTSIPSNEIPPLCKCGCGLPCAWKRVRGWAGWRRGHHRRQQPSEREGKTPEELVELANRRMYPPEGATPPLCACGCGNPTNWLPGYGWGRWLHAHNVRGRPGLRLGVKALDETRARQSKSLREHYAGIRRRDREPTGPGVYATSEYLQARADLVEGKPCCRCGNLENIHAHHAILGDDSSLVPMCKPCHASHHHSTPYTKRNQPPTGSVAPLCACGCGRPVKWKRVRGWATYCKGHGVAKVSGKIRCQEAPACQCGCGEPVKFRHGVGWNPYKRGHGQRVYGHYKTLAKAKTPAP